MQREDLEDIISHSKEGENPSKLIVVTAKFKGRV